MSHSRPLVTLLLLAAFALSITPALADEPFGFDSSLNIYTEVPYSKLPLKSVRSWTLVDGPVAKTHIVYKFIDGLKQTMEVGANFRLPTGAVLNGFGYYYGRRFIPGVIYTNDQAWQIYTAVTSRGRDPGIMDRPEQQDYHTQIYPVLPGHYLTVVIDITQMLPTNSSGARFTLPLQQPEGVAAPVHVDSRVLIHGDFAASGDYPLQTSIHSRNGQTALHLVGEWMPSHDWTVTVKRRTTTSLAVFSRLAIGESSGTYAATISLPHALDNARIRIGGRTGANLSLPTNFGHVAAYAPLSFTGRYSRAGIASLTILSSNRRPIRLKLVLGSQRMDDRRNPAAIIWADKRISALQDSPRDRKAEVIRLSCRYTVVSSFTALLAIPHEELERYRRMLARQKVSTNTEYIGGGGGDPMIRIAAPSDAKQVVAVFPDGSAKTLAYDAVKRDWATRFDYPLGTPAGDYLVTIIVVHADGHRTRFVLVYENLVDTPNVQQPQAALTALRGGRLDVRVRSTDAVKATLVTPWQARIPMSEHEGEWGASADLPGDWPLGPTSAIVVLYDGAHDRTEVTIDVQVK